MTVDPSRRLLQAAALVVLFGVALRCAWIGDDAYITLRTVENAATGAGLRWNPDDRVQTYTHPLWMLLLTATRWLTGASYLPTICLSLGLSLLAAALLLRRAATSAAVVACGLALVGTRAFTDYCTSGLETPLTFVLLALFVEALLPVASPDAPRWTASAALPAAPAPRFGRAAVCAALLATNRMDLALLCAPALLAALPGRPLGPSLRTLLLAGAPFFGWLLFATVYYGSPFPVTAHAKAFGVGIPAGDMARQGLHYARFALTDDPALLPIVAAGLVAALRMPGARGLAVGGLLYCAYVVKVGGDFMAGRFFLPPFVVALAVLAARWSRWPQRVATLSAVAIVGLAALRGLPQWLLPPRCDTAPALAQLMAQGGVGDERRVYYPALGLFAPGRHTPRFGELHGAVRPEGGGRWLLLNGAVGVAGFGAGREGTLLDPLLCDPLLTRLPAKDPGKWRIGHIVRRVPEGYYESLVTGENRIHHPGLRAYWDALRLATRAPVFDGKRWRALWQLWSGELDAGFRDFVATEYRTPPTVDVAAADLADELPLGTYWFDEPKVKLVYDGGVLVRWSPAAPARTLRLQAMGFCDFRVRFLRDGVVVGEAKGAPQPQPPQLPPLRAIVGLRQELVAVPAGVGAFDAVWIEAVENALSHTATGPAGLALVRRE
jgi:arabinofuranosyltransferase